MEMNKIEKIEMYFAFFCLMLAVTNIIFVLLNAKAIFLKPFSIALSLIIFYYAYMKIIESEIFNRISMLFFMNQLEKQAAKKAKEILKCK